MKRAVVVSDIHFPFEDKTAYSLFLKILDECKPNELILNGDILDCYNISDHLRDPEIKLYFEEEIEYSKVKLVELRKIMSLRKIVFITGNHEQRLERQVSNQCPQLFPYIDIGQLLEFEKLGIERIKYGPNQGYKPFDCKLIIRHENIAGGPCASYSSAVKACHSIMFGHLHRVQEVQVTTIDGSVHKGISLGCLADKNHAAMQYTKNFTNWQLGFAVLTVLDDGSWFNQNISIFQFGNTYRCMFDGKIYEASVH